jgi:hypothetical protein
LAVLSVTAVETLSTTIEISVAFAAFVAAIPE